MRRIFPQEALDILMLLGTFEYPPSHYQIEEKLELLGNSTLIPHIVEAIEFGLIVLDRDAAGVGFRPTNLGMHVVMSDMLSRIATLENTVRRLKYGDSAEDAY